MRRPVNAPYTITTEFGVPDSYAKFGRHAGVDYAVPSGRPIYAPVSGQLTNVISQTGGNMVVIFDGRFYHRLMHNSSFSRSNGQVSEGEEVAKAGSTGLSTGPHCHWDINTEGTYPSSFAAFIPPADWLSGKYVQTTPQGGDMITKEDVGPVRIVMSEVEGWNPEEIHAGKNDAQIMGAWVGRDFRELLWNGWNKNQRKRQQLLYEITDKDNQIADASKALAAKSKEVEELKAQLAVQSEDTELLNGFGLWLTKLIARLGLKK